MERPMRSPIEIPDLVKSYIKGKSFCEIGCGEGDLLRLFAKHAAEAVGVEMREKHFPKLDILEREVNNIRIIKADVMHAGFPICDSYFIWCKPKTDRRLFQILPASTIISFKALINKQWLVDRYNEHTGDTKWIEFTSNEDIEPYPASSMITGEPIEVTKNTPLVIGILFKE